MMPLNLLAEWIEQHLNQPLPLSRLATKAGCSIRYLSICFRRACGLSVGAYIQKRRLTVASTLLRITRRSTTEIALIYQFSHLSSFTRAFKKQFGQPPQAFRQAWYWDMALFYPSMAVTDFICQTDIVSIPDNTWIIPVNNKRKEIHFSLDFIITTKNGKIISDQNIHQSMIKTIFRKEVNYPLVVCGNVYPGTECDTDVDIILGAFTHANNKNRVSVRSGHYACFVFKGTPPIIMQFHSWAQGHGMHRYRLVMKRGPTFSVFDKTATEGVYKMEYYIPCLTEDIIPAKP
ncbi:AraC family transcriptional regulator [Salmonella enterica subsp. enterica serovar Urbana]|nr:helix-turn-helix domain-containing protein [Salmonella enterica subsp. enterica serovar Chester]EGI5934722.1 AraC family transcriptional regulator [Salmonella enterica subsp. enterica serovar Urbana]MLT46689.1 AraC family transcriptional regulator [Salmonella enterica subsp. enterica serovar Chester]